MNYRSVLVDHDSGRSLRQWVLSPPVVVGRCPTADITIDDASISRRHCQFLFDPYGSLMARDMGSKNGVIVDQRRVEKANVRPGTEVRIGLVTLRVELTDEDRDEMDQESDTQQIYDLAETEAIQIIQPEDDRYDIG